MATPESAQPTAGPRYAPDDPTLPKPWTGLIDGSTGLLYYWNPETNVTQYEKPAVVPAAPLQAASTPKLAQIPVAHSSQQQQQTQPISHWPPQQGHQTMAQAQVSANLLHVMPVQGGQHAVQSEQSRPQAMQHPAYQMLSPTGWQAPLEGNHHYPQHSGQPIQNQPIRQMHNPAVQQMLHPQRSEAPQPQGQQFAYQQMQHMPYQRNMLMPGQPDSQQQTQLAMQGQQLIFNQHEYEAGLPQAIGGKVDPVQNSQSAFSTPQSGNVLASQALPAGCKPVPNHPADPFFGRAQHFGASPIVEQPTSTVQFQQAGTAFAHHQLGPNFQSHTSSSISHNQQYGPPRAEVKMGYEDSLHGGAVDGYLSNAEVEGPIASQPKLASLPMTRNQQDLRIVDARNDFPAGFASTLNSAGHPRHHLHYNAAETPSFGNNSALDRAPFNRPFNNIGQSPADLYRREHEVTATGGNIPAPFITFEATGFPPEILRDIRSAGFLSPTPIQAQTWPIALENRDIVAIAKTGSGKTLGYLIPAFILLRRCSNNPQSGPTVLVVAPTRELASQILEEVKKFGRSSRISCTCLYGGAPKGPQLEQLARGADIVVATPGRLNDILEMRKIYLGQVSLLVLDEADRMLDMGFEPQIRKIVNEMPKQRQTLMYTATWPKEVRKIASDLLVNPIQVNIGSVDELEANKSITQYVEVVPQMEKERRLDQILREQVRGSKVIVFCSTKRLCDQLARSIGRKFGAAAIHGDKSQGERDWVLNQFRSGMSPVLVATDVAARGLDVKDIRVVINYDFPNGIEDYVHRIGRTGRAGATGVSYTFFSEQDWKYAADLVKVLEGANQHVPPEVRQIALCGGSGGRDRGGMSRYDSGMTNDGECRDFGQRQDFGGRGRGGTSNSGFNGLGGMREGGFSTRGNSRDAPFTGRGGRYDSFPGRGRRYESFSGRGNRGWGFGGPSNWDRNDRGPLGRSNYVDGRGRGRGRGRYDGRRELEQHSRGRSYSHSPKRVRKRSYSRSHSRSRSWSRSRSRSRSWSRSRSCSHSRSRSYSQSPRRSRSPIRSRSRSRSRGLVVERTESSFDKKEPVEQESKAPESGIFPISPALNVDPLPASVCVQTAATATHGVTDESDRAANQ